MGLDFINVNTGEHRDVSDIGTALNLVRARNWTIKDPEASPYTQGWEIGLSTAPMQGAYPNISFDVSRFDPDNVNFYNQRLGQMFTLRQLLAWANTAPAAPPVDPIDYPLPPPALPYVPPAELLPGPPLLPVDLVSPVLHPVEPIFTGPGPKPMFPWDLEPASMMPAEKWTVTIDDDGGFTSTRSFPVRVVVEGKGRLVYSEAELSDALSNGGHIAGPDDILNRGPDLIVRPEVPLDDWPGPKPIEYAEPAAAGFPWWLLLLGAGLAFSQKRRGS